MAPIIFRRAIVDEIIDLRHEILRTGLPRETAHFDGDDEPSTRHFAAVLNESIIGCVTILRRPFDGKAAWQLRGMAVAAAHRNAGIGAKLLAAVDEFVEREAPLNLWCNARVPAARFYEKHGWKIVSAEFMIESAGPHVKMFKPIERKQI